MLASNMSVDPHGSENDRPRPLLVQENSTHGCDDDGGGDDGDDGGDGGGLPDNLFHVVV